MARVKFAKGTKSPTKTSRRSRITKKYQRDSSRTWGKERTEKGGVGGRSKKKENNGPTTVSPSSLFVKSNRNPTGGRRRGKKGDSLDFNDEEKEEGAASSRNLGLCVDFRMGYRGNTEEDAQGMAFRVFMGEFLEGGVRRGLLGKGSHIVGAFGLEEAVEFGVGKGAGEGWSGEGLKVRGFDGRACDGGGEERSDEWNVVSYVRRRYTTFAVASLQLSLRSSSILTSPHALYFSVLRSPRVRVFHGVVVRILLLLDHESDHEPLANSDRVAQDGRPHKGSKGKGEKV